MKKILILLIIFSFLLPFFCNAGDVYVHGYYRHDGTYVRPYHRTTPDGNPYNNYSTKGNINPWTGKRGTIDPYNNGMLNSPYRFNQNPFGSRSSNIQRIPFD